MESFGVGDEYKITACAVPKGFREYEQDGENDDGQLLSSPTPSPPTTSPFRRSGEVWEASLKTQLKKRERNTMELQAKTEGMATEIKAQGRVTLQLKEAIVGAEAEIRQQSVRIGYLEEEIARITRETFSFRQELGIYQMRPAEWEWVDLAMAIALGIRWIIPLTRISRSFFGRPN